MLKGIAEGLGDAAIRPRGGEQFRPIGHGPQAQQGLNAGDGGRPRGGVGHQRHIAQAEHLPVAFVVGEQEGLVLLDRPAQRSPELIALEVGNLRLVEEISRVQGIVAKELVDIAVQLVGAGSGGDIDLGPGAFPIFGAVGILDDGEFLHRVHAQKLPARPSRCVVHLRRAGEFHPVQKVEILLRAPARNRKHVADHRVRCADAARALRGVINDAGIERQELVVAPAIQRQVLHLAVVHQSRDIGGGHIGHEACFHHNRLVDSSEGERQIDGRVLSQHQRDIPLRRIEPGLFGGNLVRPHGKQRSFIPARVVGEDGANGPLLRVDDLDGGMRDGAAGGIGGNPGNKGLTLRPYQRRR